ncbi:MAG: helix-turn-helix transcriptional regulator [Patescibacteria group bacterium]
MINEDSKKFGENLRRIRINKNITQVEIANILGVDRSFVSNIENGKNNPTLSTITSLAKALNIPIDELFK